MYIAFIIPIISFLFQAYPRFFKRSFGVDVWTRLLEIDELRKNNHTIPHKKLSGQFIIDGYFDYPPIFPWMLSFIPKKRLQAIEGFIAPFFDSIQVFVIFYVTQFFTTDYRVALLAQALYAVTPMVAIENSYLTPRSFGYLNFSLVVLSILGFYAEGSPEFLVAVLIFSTLIFLTHRFATQSFFFITLFFTFYLNTALFFQAFIIGFVGAVIFTKGYYLRVLKGHLANIYFWVLYKEYRFAHQVRGIANEKKQQDWVGQVYQLLQVFSPVIVFALNPWALSSFVVILLGYFKVLNFTNYEYIFSAWILFFYFLGVLVLKIKALIPIGEGQRYMEMATVPSVVLSSLLFFKLSSVFPSHFIFIFYGLVALYCLLSILFVQIKGVIGDKNRSLDPQLEKVFQYINAQNRVVRIVCIPHQNTTLTLYNTKAQVLVNADNPGLLKINDVYPILRLSLAELKKKYSLTHALVRTSFVTLKELKVKQSQVIFSAGDSKLIKL